MRTETAIGSGIPFALQSYGDAFDQLRRAQGAGFEHFFLDASHYADLDAYWTPNRVMRLHELAAEACCFPVLHGNFRLPLSTEIESLRSTAVELAKKEIYLARELSCPLILHGGPITEPRNAQQRVDGALRHLRRSLAELSAVAADLGVHLALENLSNHRSHPHYYVGTTPAEFEALLDALPGLRVFLDVGHANVGGGDSLRFLNRVFPALAGVSFSDNDGRRDSHLSLGRGTVPVETLANALRDAGWVGLVAIECRSDQPETDRDLLARFLRAN